MIEEILLSCILAVMVGSKIRPRLERAFKHWQNRRRNR